MGQRLRPHILSTTQKLPGVSLVFKCSIPASESNLSPPPASLLLPTVFHWLTIQAAVTLQTTTIFQISSERTHHLFGIHLSFVLHTTLTSLYC